VEIIGLGGRRWRIIETSTLEHVIWMDLQTIESGLGRMLQQPIAASETEAHAGAIWEAISRSQKAFSLLGGMLVPEVRKDEDWTPDIAELTAHFLKKLTAPEDHARIRALLVSVVLGFFVAGRRSAGLSAAALASHPRASGDPSEIPSPGLTGGSAGMTGSQPS
jgi:hypothetical protein